VSHPDSTDFFIPGPSGNLEARLNLQLRQGPLSGDKPYVGIVCHPHPLHGGTMDNKVVTTLVRAYAELGVPAVRFNTRGTGRSAGVHDNGVGEVEDLLAVAAWAENKYPGASFLLSGFSFGSGVAGNGALVLDRVAHLTLVAPPVGRYGFPEKTAFPCPWTLVMGDQDELVEASQVYEWAQTITPAPQQIRMAEATHFFHGHLVALRTRLVEVIANQLSAR
jgi:alpha/beta superfamily hydrolase